MLALKNVSASQKRVPVRKLVSVVMAAGLLASLAACSAAPVPYASCEPSGNAALVTAKGKLDADPKAEFPTPLVAKKAQLAVPIHGDGAQVTAGSTVEVTVSIYDGTTGDALETQSGPITAQTIRVFVTDGNFPFSSAAQCATVGSRVVSTGTASQLFGSDSLGLDPETALVVVSDIDAVYLGKANGADQVPQAGYPAVVLAPDGRPGLTFPAGETPKSLAPIALKQGSGATVKEGDGIIVNITGVVWGAKTTFIDSWDRKAPTGLLITDLASDGTGVIPAIKTALVGQKVGSQMLVVAAGDDSYPSGSAPSGVAEGDTVVFVVDILGIAK